MKISVITVCYNAAASIENTIKSVLGQTYGNIEYIIIDGKSSDSTVDIVSRYRDKLAYFSSEKDSGIYQAMNKGIRAANGAYLFFLNAGDVFYNETVLEKVAVGLLEHTNKDIVYGDVLVVNAAKAVSRLKSHEDLDKLYFLWDTICHQAVFFSSGSFKVCGLYDESMRIDGDFEWLLRALWRYKLSTLHLPLPIAIFYQDGISSNEQYKAVHLEERRLALQRYFSKWELKLYPTRMFTRWAAKPLPRRVMRLIFGWYLP